MGVTVSNGSGANVAAAFAADLDALKAQAELAAAAESRTAVKAPTHRISLQALNETHAELHDHVDEIQPPAPRLTAVQEASAEAAFSAIAAAFGALGSLRGELGDAGDLGAAAAASRISLKDLGQATTSTTAFLGKLVPMIELQVRFFNMQQEFFLLSAGGSKDSMGQIRDSEAVGQKKQLTLEVEAAEQNRRIAEKSKKGEIVSMVLSWTMGAAQVASGAMKLMVGIPTGALEIASGFTSMSNALLKTLVYRYPNLEEKLRPHIKRLDIAEIAMAGACAVVGAIDLKRMIRGGAEIAANAKRIVSGTTTLASKTAGTGSVFVQTATKAGITAAEGATKVAAEAAQKSLARGMLQAFQQSEKAGVEFCEQIGKRVATDSAREIGIAFNKRLLMVPGSGEKSFAALYSKVFGNAAIEKMITGVMADVGKSMSKAFSEALAAESLKVLGKDAVKAGARLSAEASEAVLDRVAQKLLKDATSWLTFDISRQVGWNMTQEIAKITASITMASTAVSIATHVAGYEIKQQQNGLQERANRAMEQFMWLEFMKSVFELLVNGQKDQARTRGDEFATHTENAMENIRTLGQSTQLGFFGGAGSTA